MPFQPSLNIDVKTEATLDDFCADCYTQIVHAMDRLCQGEFSELFVYGSTGVGKTHLALATHNIYPKSAIHLPLQQLTNQDDGTTALIGIEAFDLVILDDLHAIAGKSDWQEALFDLINHTRKQQKQLLFLANTPVHDLNITLPDLLTRLSVAPALRLPDSSDIYDRTAVIHAILKRKNWRLPDEILQYMIDEGPHNVRDINFVLDSISPLFTHLTRIQVPKKIIEEAKDIIQTQSILLEIGEHLAITKRH